MRIRLVMQGIVVSSCLFAWVAGRQTQTLAAYRYPTVDQLPVNGLLQDPFQFFGSDRRVKNKKDWEERRAEM